MEEEKTLPIAPDRTTPNRMQILFEITLKRPALTFYRGVRGADGSFRLERRGALAKQYKTLTWCGCEESLYRLRAHFEDTYGLCAILK